MGSKKIFFIIFGIMGGTIVTLSTALFIVINNSNNKNMPDINQNNVVVSNQILENSVMPNVNEQSETLSENEVQIHNENNNQAGNNFQQSTDNNQQQSNSQQSTNNNQQQNSSQHSTNNNQQQNSSQHSTNNNQQQNSSQQPTNNNQQQSNSQQSTDNNQQQSNSQHSTNNNQQQSNSQQANVEQANAERTIAKNNYDEQVSEINNWYNTEYSRTQAQLTAKENELNESELGERTTLAYVQGAYSDYINKKNYYESHRPFDKQAAEDEVQGLYHRYLIMQEAYNITQQIDELTNQLNNLDTQKQEKLDEALTTYNNRLNDIKETYGI